MTKETRVHHKITVAIFGRDSNGKVTKDVIHTAELYTGVDREGNIESVHDRMKRFVEECSGGEGIAEAPAYQIAGVELADAKDKRKAPAVILDGHATTPVAEAA